MPGGPARSESGFPQPLGGNEMPRFAGITTFMRLLVEVIPLISTSPCSVSRSISARRTGRVPVLGRAVFARSR